MNLDQIPKPFHDLLARVCRQHWTTPEELRSKTDKRGEWCRVRAACIVALHNDRSCGIRITQPEIAALVGLKSHAQVCTILGGEPARLRACRRTERTKAKAKARNTNKPRRAA